MSSLRFPMSLQRSTASSTASLQSRPSGSTRHKFMMALYSPSTPADLWRAKARASAAESGAAGAGCRNSVDAGGSIDTFRSSRGADAGAVQRCRPATKADAKRTLLPVAVRDRKNTTGTFPGGREACRACSTSRSAASGARSRLSGTLSAVTWNPSSASLANTSRGVQMPSARSPAAPAACQKATRAASSCSSDSCVLWVMVSAAASCQRRLDWLL
mmetsp:Transcript_1708/g.4969  ORF Transcript_1708/g.4969 Transcript_1708/m.4969 type:complete len:216 (-) Transcript_1708:1804-2451(-)